MSKPYTWITTTVSFDQLKDLATRTNCYLGVDEEDETPEQYLVSSINDDYEPLICFARLLGMLEEQDEQSRCVEEEDL